MLVGTPLPVILSVFVALGPGLWIRRALVRAQEGQLTVCGVAAPNWARRVGFSVATNEKAPQAKSLWGLIVTSHWMWGCWSADTTLA